ncbi:MAG: hypothetical protein JNM43_12230 [Planctomycetaceae bacterium]|nr:hypothetical protein [Planctomycetaceae bacterium]
MSGLYLERKLQAVSQRLQKVRILRRQALVWLLLLIPAIAVTLYLPRREGAIGPEVPVVLIATLLGISLSRVLARRPSLNEAARLIEQADSEVNDAVLTAVEVMQTPAKQSSVLAGMAVMDAEKLARQRDWSAAVPGRQIAGWTVLSFLTFLLMASSVTAASRFVRTPATSDANTAKAEADSEKKPPVTELVIEPGNTEIELATALTVVAKFPGTVPQKVVLEFEDAKKQVRQLSMTETVDVGVFAARMEEITSDGVYRVLYLETEDSSATQPNRSPDYLVKTFVRPRLEQIDATVTPPHWTRKSEETIEDIARITVTEGSSVVFRFQLNKPGVKAELRSENEAAIPLTVSASDPTVVESNQVVKANHSWTIHLTDAEGRTAADEETLTVKVTRNQPPVIKPTFPGRDVNVSALEEFQIEASAKDDFELLDYGIEYSLSGSEPVNVSTRTTIAEGASAGTGDIETAATISGQIQLETMNAAPDDLVTYSYWAKDYASDGTVRTTYSDLMFAEVRRFEEIFREGQQQGQQQQQQRQQQQQQQQQQQGGAADELLKVQKEILSATWNTLQTEAIKRDAGTFSEDVGVIAESQGQLIQQLQSTLAEREMTPEIQALATAAADLMTQAQSQLQEVRDGKEGTTLRNAMATESRILAALYRMREAEYNVQRQQQQGGGGGGGGGSASAQQQLQQLELDNERNRYESERQAQQQQEANSAQREELQILNRLKELARRQQMVNERLKQLESELRAAQSDKEKEEIERELKRLRDEQRDLLRDTDDVAERMEQSQQSQQSQQQQQSQQSQESQGADREQMQQEIQEARNNVQQASRAMDEGRLAEAISEGTRAERQFDDLKEDFRNQTSNRFDEAARDLRDEARELADQQEKIARELSGESEGDDSKSKSPSLRSERKKEDVEQKLQDQQDRLNKIVEDSKKLIEQAEETEPLLSSRLYDAVRDLKDSKPEEALEAAEMLAGRGLWPQTQEAEQQARKGIERLREGIEKAADAVVGSEAESLRRAQEQLEGVTEQLANEVRNATGEETENGQQQNGQQQNGQQQNGQQQNGQQQNGQQQNGQQQNGQQQNGQQQNGQQQNGQQQNGQPQNGQQQNGQQQNGQPKNGQQQNGQPKNGQQQNGQQQNGQRSALMNGGRESNGGLGANNTPGQPLTGNEFGQWSDQLRDVEEMLDDPELRNRVAQVRDRARAIRSEFKRHGTEPQWDLVKSQLLGELQSLQQRIAEDLQKMKSDRAMVPIDREPVPEEFDSMVQRYYELLGQERLKDEPAGKK